MLELGNAFAASLLDSSSQQVASDIHVGHTDRTGDSYASLRFHPTRDYMRANRVADRQKARGTFEAQTLASIACRSCRSCGFQMLAYSRMKIWEANCSIRPGLSSLVPRDSLTLLGILLCTALGMLWPVGTTSAACSRISMFDLHQSKHAAAGLIWYFEKIMRACCHQVHYSKTTRLCLC